jgi:hypothetical protein
LFGPKRHLHDPFGRGQRQALRQLTADRLAWQRIVVEQRDRTEWRLARRSAGSAESARRFSGLSGVGSTNQGRDLFSLCLIR